MNHLAHAQYLCLHYALRYSHRTQLTKTQLTKLGRSHLCSTKYDDRSPRSVPLRPGPLAHPRFSASLGSHPPPSWVKLSWVGLEKTGQEKRNGKENVGAPKLARNNSLSLARSARSPIPLPVYYFVTCSICISVGITPNAA